MRYIAVLLALCLALALGLSVSYATSAAFDDLSSALRLSERSARP